MERIISKLDALCVYKSKPDKVMGGKKMSKAVTLGAIATGALIGALAQPAYAQQSQSGAAEGIQDIVVTARRTEESLQTTPIAVTALTP